MLTIQVISTYSYFNKALLICIYIMNYTKIRWKKILISIKYLFSSCAIKYFLSILAVTRSFNCDILPRELNFGIKVFYVLISVYIPPKLGQLFCCDNSKNIMTIISLLHISGVRVLEKVSLSPSIDVVIDD